MITLGYSVSELIERRAYVLMGGGSFRVTDLRDTLMLLDGASMGRYAESVAYTTAGRLLQKWKKEGRISRLNHCTWEVKNGRRHQVSGVA